MPGTMVNAFLDVHMFACRCCVVVACCMHVRMQTGFVPSQTFLNVVVVVACCMHVCCTFACIVACCCCVVCMQTGFVLGSNLLKVVAFACMFVCMFVCMLLCLHALHVDVG